MLLDFSADVKIGYLINTTKELAGVSSQEFELENQDTQAALAYYSEVAG